MLSKIFWLVVIAVAVVAFVPPVRQKVWPKIQPAFDPIYEWNARTRVNEIRDVVKRADATGRPVPTGAEFDHFVDVEDSQENASVDPWGTDYYIIVSATSFQVGSAGKDRQPGTDDDILSTPEALSHPQERRF